MKLARPPLSVRGREADILAALCLTTAFLAALLIRLVRLQQGLILLDEFDPYFQYWMARRVVEEGWRGFADWFTWFKVYKFWFPHGRDVVHTAFPGLAFTGAFIYMLISSMGVKASLMEVCSLLPPFMGALTVVAIYALGREVDGRAAGLYAAAFMAFISPSFYLSRTLLGFFDDESVGILAMACALAFYVRALKKDDNVADAALAGLFLGYMAATWGAAAYVMNLMAVHAAVATLMDLLTGRYARRLLYAYPTTMGVALLIASMVPKHGPRFMASGLGFTILAALAIVVIGEALSALRPRQRSIAMVGAVAAVSVGVASLWALGLLTAPERYLSVLNPAIRSPLVSSVAEHQPVTWAYFISEYHLLLPLALAGLYFALRRHEGHDVLVALMALTTFYAASSMARLMALLAPVIAVLAGIGLHRALSPVIEGLKAREAPKRKARYAVGPHRAAAALTLMVVAALITPAISPIAQPLVRAVVARAKSPPIIATSTFSIAAEVPDWLNTLAWMRENLPANAVVACWWDYGYHTAVVADRASICDNAALDQRQIAMVARAFLSDEEEALKIFRELGATHVVVFGFVVPAYEWAKVEELRGYWISLGGVVGDDVVKSRWMALIAGLDPADYLGTTTFRLPNADVLVSIVTPMGERAEDAVLYRMIFNNYEGPLRLWRGKILKRVEVDEQMNVVGVEEFHVKPLEHFKLVYASEPNRFVLVYEIVYD